MNFTLCCKVFTKNINFVTNLHNLFDDLINDTHVEVCWFVESFFPVTIASPELSAKVAEFMGWYGQNNVIPEYYDVNLKYKQNDDVANLEMLDLIRNKLRVTPNETYGAVAGGKSVMTMTQTTATNTSETGFYSNPTSNWEDNVSALSSEIKAYIFKYYQ